MSHPLTSRCSYTRLMSNAIMLVQLIFPTISSATTCYRMNGIEGNSDIRPCNSNLASGKHSACCNLGKDPPDVCLSGGLCYRQDGYDGNFLIYAVGCTDMTGVDTACQQYCSAGNDTAMYSLNACFDGRWCCNDLATSESCCDKSTGGGTFTMNHLLSMYPTPSSTADAATVTVTASSTQSNQPENPASRSDNCATDSNLSSCSGGTKVLVGASVGAAIGGVVLASIVTYFLMRRLHGSGKQHQIGRLANGHAHLLPTAVGPESGWRHEMDIKNQPVVASTQMQEESAIVMPRTVRYEIDDTKRAELRGSC